MKALKSLWHWIKEIHAAGDGASAKRVYGGIIIIACSILLYLFSRGSEYYFTIPIWKEIKDTMENFFLIGASLVGLDTVRQIWSIGAGKQKDKGNSKTTTND